MNEGAARGRRTAPARENFVAETYNLGCLRAVNADPEGALASLHDAVKRELAIPALLVENDCASIRTLAGCSELATRVRVAAARSIPR